MSNEPTIEAMNIVLGRFMGIEATDDFFKRNCRYHSSWNALMPVWVKWRNAVPICKDSDDWKNSLSYYLFTSDEPKRFFERLYYAIIWYDQQPTTNDKE